jgi:hypothetical protein
VEARLNMDNQFVIIALTPAAVVKGHRLALVDIDNKFARLGFGPEDSEHDEETEEAVATENAAFNEVAFIEALSDLLTDGDIDIDGVSDLVYNVAQRVYTYDVNGRVCTGAAFQAFAKIRQPLHFLFRVKQHRYQIIALQFQRKAGYLALQLHQQRIHLRGKSLGRAFQAGIQLHIHALGYKVVQKAAEGYNGYQNNTNEGGEITYEQIAARIDILLLMHHVYHLMPQSRIKPPHRSIC